MRRLTMVVAVVCGLIVGQAISAPVPEEPSNTLSLAERVRIATQIYHWVTTYFAHWQGVPKLDFEKEYQRYLDEILASDDRRAFSLASMELLAKLHNGHTGFGDQWLRQADGMMLNFNACLMEDKWVVVRSQVDGLRAGDVIVAIDGEPFEHFYQRQSIYISASDERWARRALFELPYLFPKAFTLTLADGRKFAIVRHGDFRWPGSEFDDITVTKKKGTVYIRIPSFSNPKFEERAIEAVKQNMQASAVIVDARSNHGGSSPNRLTELLMDRPYRWFSEATPMRIGLFSLDDNMGQHSYAAWTPSLSLPIEGAYRGRVVILTNGGCFSACEDFIAPFKDNHRATIVGERTAGSSGQPAGKDLGHGMGIGVSTKRESMPDGTAFEGIGIAPDVQVPVTIKDLLEMRDAVLEKAEQLLGDRAAR